MEKIFIKNEVFTITQNQTLVLNNPAQVTFLNNGLPGEYVLINNSLIIYPFRDVLTGTADAPANFTLQNNGGEVDTTNYQVIFPTGAGNLTVICKYYVKE